MVYHTADHDTSCVLCTPKKSDEVASGHHKASTAFAFMYVDQKLLKTITPVTIFLSDVPLPVSGVKGFLLESYSITCCVSLASLLTLASVASLCCSLVL